MEFATGCSARIWRAKWTLKRQKSTSSHGVSISACWAVFDWPSMVEAASFSRHGPDSSSAARRMIAARSSKDIERQAGAAARAASMASCASAWVALAKVPSTDLWSCGWTTSKRSPPPIRLTPLIVIGRSIGFSDSCLSCASSRARSGVPGAYEWTGSLTGAGTWVTASMGLVTP